MPPNVKYAEVKITVDSALSANGTVFAGVESLMNVAEALANVNNEAYCTLSVIVSHTACEVALEKALTKLLRLPDHKQTMELARCVFGKHGYGKIQRQKDRCLYFALTGDIIQEWPRWGEFKKSIDCRNAVVHDGKLVDSSTAKTSLDIARALIARIQSKAVSVLSA